MPAPSPYHGPPTVESLGRELREVLPTRRVQSISVCDAEANVLWLSEGALGPDEHAMVIEALEQLIADSSLPCHEMGSEDGRLAMFLPVRAPDTTLVGIVMVLADGKCLDDDTLERVAAQPVLATLARLAELIKPPVTAADTPGADASGSAAVAGAEAMSAEKVNDLLEFELAPEDSGHVRIPDVGEMMDLEFIKDEPARPAAGAAHADAPPSPAMSPAASAAPSAPAAAAPKAATGGAEKRARDEPATAPPAAATAAAATSEPCAPPASDPNLLLELLPFAKLRPGGQSRRFQVIARMSTPLRDPAVQDALVLQRLMGWLASHRTAWNTQPTGFTVSLSIATLEDERFAHKLAAALNSHAIGADTIGFEIAESLCTQRRAQVERFLAQCEKVGAWVVIDGFSFDAQTVPLLRSKALRLVKIDPKLTTAALKDKLSQAMVVASVQAAKVLGIHCAAQKVDSQASLQWLTAIGCDLAQGSVIGRPLSLDSVSTLPETIAPTEHLRSASQAPSARESTA